MMSCWYGRTIYDWLTGICPTLAASIAKHRGEWRSLLGLPVLSLLLILFGAVSAAAQAAPTDRFEWSIAAPTLAVANAYRYDLELDAVILPTALVTTCTGAVSPFICRAPIPAVTPTAHVARVRAVDTTATVIVGPFSDPINFTMRATPAKPAGLTVVPGA